ncbi:hypothetical protein PR002_g9969 [Phytophthora rubi]|uniref:Uncharacterized protein n=1 Tax=Phytophthora rubi TaxID=129364 RepID=A0A6A3ML08_9STRA|nr:hypothetical protein PR002_g9969 [Phytophthora rubi]
MTWRNSCRDLPFCSAIYSDTRSVQRDPLVSSCRGPIKEVAEEVAAVEPSEPVVEAAVVESEEATEQQEQATAETDVEAAEPVVEVNALV